MRGHRASGIGCTISALPADDGAIRILLFLQIGGNAQDILIKRGYILMIQHPSRATFAYTLSNCRHVQNRNRQADRPRFGQGMAPGFVPDREHRGDMRTQWGHLASEFAAGIGAVEFKLLGEEPAFLAGIS